MATYHIVNYVGLGSVNQFTCRAVYRPHPVLHSQLRT